MRRRQTCIFFLIALLLIFSRDNALGQQRALFLLDGLRQSVELNYQYDGRETASDGGPRAGSRQQRFEELYHFGINYAIYDPRVLKGRFAADGKLTQETLSGDSSSGNGYGTDYQYSLDGTLLSEKPTPISFFSRSGTSRVQRLFSRGYDLTSDSNGATVAYNNHFLPALFSYSRVTNETSGLEEDRQQQTENFLFTLSNSFRQLSRTELALSRFTDASNIKGDGGDVSSKTDNLTFANNLSWESAGKRRSVYSLYRFIKETGEREEELSYLQESVNWDLGKALRWGFDYWFSHRRVPSLIETENQGRTWLEHQLFRSLTTRISLRARQADMSTGRETFSSGEVDLVYQKKMPMQGRLQLELALAVDITDRNLKDSLLTAPDETFVAGFIAPYRLLHTGVLVDTIQLRSTTPGSLHFSVPFTEGIDYTVAQTGAFTEIRIIPGGNIVEGVDSLVVTYKYRENPDIKYATYGRRIGGSLTLLDGRYRLYTNVEQSDQELLAGHSDVLQLNDVNIYRLGAEFAEESHTVGAEYVDYDSTLDKHRSMEATWRYGLSYGIHSLTLRLNDRYTRFETSTSGSSRRWENIVSGGAVYRRPLSSFATLRIKADYANATGDNVSRNNISAGASILMRISKFMLTLTSLVSWQKSDSLTIRNDLVRLQLVRFF